MGNLDQRLKEVEDIGKNSTKKSLDYILECVKDSDDMIKLAAVEALSSFREYVEAKKVLINLTKDIDEEIRYTAIEALSNFEGEDIGKTITERLKDSNSIVRITAAETLGYIAYEKAIPDLCEALSDSNELVRGYAAEAMGKIGDRSQVSLLKDKFKIEKRNAARLRFYTGLYLLGEREFFGSILKMLKCRSYRVRCAAANTLLELADLENMDFDTIQLMIKSLQRALLIEKTVAAKSSISNAISELSEKRQER